MSKQAYFLINNLHFHSKVPFTLALQPTSYSLFNLFGLVFTYQKCNCNVKDRTFDVPESYTLPHLKITLTIFYREKQSFDITDDVPRARVEALTRAWISKEAS